MRDVLTILAVVLIAVLATALVAPYFIDWSSHRALIEARLSKAAGTRVAIAGAIDVKLLPQPVFRLGKVTIGGAVPGAPSFTADQVDVSIALTALMRGEVQIADATLRHPHLDLAAAGSDVPLLGQGVTAPDRFQFQHVAIVDGTFSVTTKDRGRFTLTGLDLDAQATSLLGPFTATGTFGPAADRHPFRLATGAFDNGRMRLKLGLDGAQSRPAVNLDGALIAVSAVAGQPRRLSFDGSVTVAGDLPLDASPSTVPWRLTGHVTSDGSAATIGEVELQAGTEMRALDATGTGSATLAGSPSVRLKLHAAQLDLDALAVAPEKSTLPPPRGIDLLRRLDQEHGAGPLTALAGLPFGLVLDVGLDTATAGPQTLVGFKSHLDIERGKPIGLRLAAKGPDDASLALDGRLETDPVPIFRGHLDVASRDMSRLAHWLAPALPQAEDWVRRTVPARALSFAGTVDLSSTGMAARDLVLTLDRTIAKGTLSYTAPVGGDPGRLFADLGADALDLDALPDIGDSPVDWGALDLDLTLKARAVTAVPTGIGPVDAGELVLRLKKNGPDVTLDDLSAEIGSARVSATGTMDASMARLDAHIDAPQLDAVAAAVAKVVPGRMTDMLLARSPALSPAKVDLSLAATRGGDGGLLPSTLTMDGQLAGSRVKAELKPDRPGDLDPTTATLSASLTAEADDGIALMHQLGLPVASGQPPTLGAGRFEASGSGSIASGFETSATLALAGARIAYKGRAKPELGGGHLALDGSDLSPLMRATGLAQPQPGQAWPARAEADLSWHDGTLSFRHLGGRLAGAAFSGDLTLDLAPTTDAANQTPKPELFGALTIDRLQASSLFDLALGPSGGVAPDATVWSTSSFGPMVLRLPRSAVALKVATLGLTDRLAARTASLTLKAGHGAITLADLTGTLDDGRVGATLTLRRDGPNASLDGSVSLDGVTLGGAGPTAKISGSVDLAGVGTTPAALVASLAGLGRARLIGARIPDLDSTALMRVAALSEQNTSEVDGDAIAASLATELGRAPFALGDVDGPAALATGLLRVGPLRAERGGSTVDVDATLDLRSMILGSKVVLKTRQALADWKGSPPQVTVTLAGRLGERPQRTVDAASFVNTLQARAIARDQERIDVMQQDMRERAFFNRRLKAIEADQQAVRERAKAEAEIERQLNAVPVHPPSPLPPHVAEPSATPAPGPPLPPARPSSGGRPRPAAPGPSAKPGTVPMMPPMVNVPDPTSAGRY